METNNFKTAPFFELPCDNGETVSLKHFPDKRIVLYFYPKDSTSGCTQQALDFTSQQSEFEKRNAVVIGVSKDSLKKHKSFRDKNELGILLASDEESVYRSNDAS
jgi:thioredoxin-dependent peroxiredoxin